MEEHDEKNQLSESEIQIKSAFLNISAVAGHLSFFVQTRREIPINSLESIKILLNDALVNLNKIKGF